MDEREAEVQDGKLQAQALVWNYTLGYVKSSVIKCAVELGVADTMKNKGYPISLSQLAAALPGQGQQPFNEGCLYRMMRYLVHIGLFSAETLQGEQCYGFTPATKFILKQDQESMEPFLRFTLNPAVVESFLALRTCFEQGGGAAFETVHGENLWGYASSHAEYNRIFNEAMAADATLVTPLMIRGCEEVFREIGSLVDVGGGTGTALKLIAKAFPHVKCTLLDLPHVVETLKLEAGIACVAGDMFSFVPQADAVLLMCILHDWVDEDCVKILKRCKDAIPQQGGKVIIVDVVIGIEVEQELTDARLDFDMLMMATTGGKERTQEEWRRILIAAGFSQCKITPIMAMQSVIEASR